MEPVDQIALSKRMDAQDTMLKEILTSIKGDQLGNVGLVARVIAVETEVRNRAVAADLLIIKGQVEKHDRKIWAVTLFSGAIWTAVVAFKDKIWPS